MYTRQATAPILNAGMDPSDAESESSQDFSPAYLSKALFDSFTVNTRQDVDSCETALSNYMAQCLRHTFFLSELEEFIRDSQGDSGFELDEERFNAVIGFISGIGASLARTVYQMDMLGGNTHEVRVALGPTMPDRKPPIAKIEFNRRGDPIAWFEGVDLPAMHERDLRLWASVFLNAAAQIAAGDLPAERRSESVA